MSGFILGEKSDQSQTFDEQGIRIPTTFIKTTPCYLVDVKSTAKHGYSALIFGFGLTKNIKKPVEGQLKKAGIKTPLHFLREFRVQETALEVYKIHQGKEIKPSIFFKKGEFVDVSGVSKGKGFQGVVKRHRFAGGPRTHGQSDRERAPGSIGQTTTPGRVFKGKKMAGRMGNKKIMVKKLKIIEVTDDGLVIKGLVPGARRGLLEIKSSN